MALEAFADELLVSETRYGTMRHFRNDDPVGVSLEMYGEWAQHELDLFARLLNRGDHVLDIGANVGTHALGFAALVGPGGRVVSFEPQPVIFELLRSNVHANGLTHVTCEQVALAERAGSAMLSVPDYHQRHNSGLAALQAGGTTIEIQTRTLDDYGFERCALMKLDVEGWERAVLRGGKQTLARCRPLVYAECNSIEKAWELVTEVAGEYEAWLHAPPAFNPGNVRHRADNRFGAAHETNLLLVARERAAQLRPLLQELPFLTPVPDLDALSRAFLRTTRYGETVETAERAQILSREVAELERQVTAARQSGEASGRPVLKRKVHVIIPVYNGHDDLRQLVHSLFTTYPAPGELLHFIFINDASPDPRVAAFLREPLLERADVTRLTNERNLGFIGTVNRGLDTCAYGPNGTDVIILNSDTQVHGNVFAILQDVADRSPNVASVTPLTNNGTIASIWNWPDGIDLFPGLPPELVARAIEEARIESAPVPAPSGVGFCMYMTKQALDAVGGLDPIFGKGYGEENHWCQSAAKKGFLNLITTEAFVYHHGSVSFGNSVKQQQLQHNLALLNRLHPSYDRDVQDYLQRDPHHAERLQAMWAVRRQKKVRDGLATVLFVLHTDPAYFGGGTERHTMALTQALLESGRAEVLHLYPNPEGQAVLASYVPGRRGATPQPLFKERFEKDSVFSLLKVMAPEIDTLHVQHTLGWPHWMLQAPALVPHAHKLLTLHDYYAGCPSIRMMSNGAFCGVPENLTACNDCLTTQHGFREMTMDAWRGVQARFIAQFDRVLVPSEAARRTLLRAFEVVAEPSGVPLARGLEHRIEVAPNFLLSEPGLPPARPTSESGEARKRVVYLGAFTPEKGGRLFSGAVEELTRRGHAVEIWGELGMPLPEGVTHRRYRGAEELRALAARFPADVVTIAAVWPETFSFTTFEAALDLGAPVVVGPTGNPPEVVRRFGVGEVLEALTPSALVAAVEACLKLRPHMAPRFEALREHARTLTVGAYLERAYPTLAARVKVPALPVRRLPEPARRRIVHMMAPPPPPPPAPRIEVPPLRYKLADGANEAIKSHLPAVHALSKWLMRRARGGEN
ncbi:MAG TPA: FkbM family methyltransferase [Archangium sp.]|uniref:FkbM family methyltransferase n=1 Tax=Archangium sp. TaxID=1872627 RepID=UPI002E37690B|nr:FkbM family methyltransferase [Archangium sp.]HEX5754720.1 FkbM family methyltransferase [Archangium sp.]